MVRFAAKISEHTVHYSIKIPGADPLELFKPCVQVAPPDQHLSTWPVVGELSLRDPATKEARAQAAVARRCPNREIRVEVEVDGHLFNRC